MFRQWRAQLINPGMWQNALEVDRHSTVGPLLAAWRVRTKDKLSKRAVRRFRSVTSIPSPASSSPSARHSSYFSTPSSSARPASTSPSSAVSSNSTPPRPSSFRPVVRAAPNSPPPPRTPFGSGEGPGATEATPLGLLSRSRLSSEYIKARSGGLGTPSAVVGAGAGSSGAAEAAKEEVTTEEEPESDPVERRGGLREALQARLRR